MSQYFYECHTCGVMTHEDLIFDCGSCGPDEDKGFHAVCLTCSEAIGLTNSDISYFERRGDGLDWEMHGFHTCPKCLHEKTHGKRGFIKRVMTEEDKRENEFGRRIAKYGVKGLTTLEGALISSGHYK